MRWLILVLTLPAAAWTQEYDRSEWPHWCSARDMALVQQAIEIRQMRNCRVLDGVWPLPYAGGLYSGDPRALDVDHVIPLAYAAAHGGDWTPARRAALANDPDNLLVTSASENRRKGSRGPSDYWPPAADCWYADRWRMLAERHGLTLAPEDSKTLDKRCPVDEGVNKKPPR